MNYVFNNADELADFLEVDDRSFFEKIKEQIPPAKNLLILRKALSKKPCSCGGANVKKIMEKRRERYNSFYKKIFEILSEEQLNFFKESVLGSVEEAYTGVTIKHEEETIKQL